MYESDVRAEDDLDLQYAMVDRFAQGLVPIGPLSREDQEMVDAYDEWRVQAEAEYQAQEAAGGRTVCPECGARSVVHRAVITYGHARHPEAEYSDYGQCERCGHAEL